MRKILLLFTIMILSTVGALAQFEFIVDAQNVQGDTLLLGYFYAERQYSLDTAYRTEKDKFIFEGDKELKGGLFFIHNPKTQDLAQFIVDKNHNLKFALDYSNEVKTQFANSPENDIFNNYITFLSKQRKETEVLKLNQKEGVISEAEMLEKLEEYDTKVRNYQENVIAENPGKLATSIIRVGMEIPLPEYDNSEEGKMKKFLYYKDHYFDNIDFKDDRLIRTPLLVGRVNNYFDNVVPPVADSVINAADQMLAQMEPKSDMYRYFVVDLVNKYANSKLIGMDEVFVYLVGSYISDTEDWIDQKQVAKMKDMARKMKPVLIGEIAPDFTMIDKDGHKVTLSEIESKYTLLLFFDTECGHCKKEIPEYGKFYEENKEKGITIVAVCSKFQDEVPKCWEYIEEHPEMKDWYVLADPVHESRYKINYNLTSYPMLFILDENKEIVFKQLKASQLPGLFEYLENLKKEEVQIGN